MFLNTFLFILIGTALLLAVLWAIRRHAPQSMPDRKRRVGEPEAGREEQTAAPDVLSIEIPSSHPSRKFLETCCTDHKMRYIGAQELGLKDSRVLLCEPGELLIAEVPPPNEDTTHNARLPCCCASAECGFRALLDIYLTVRRIDVGLGVLDDQKFDVVHLARACGGCERLARCTAKTLAQAAWPMYVRAPIAHFGLSNMPLHVVLNDLRAWKEKYKDALAREASKLL